MNIGIITVHPHLPSNQLLKKAAEQKKWPLNFWHPTQIPSPLPDVSLLRLGLEGLHQGTQLGQLLQKNGSIVINDPHAIQRAKNKWWTTCALQENNLPTAPTRLFTPSTDVDYALSPPFDHFPLILKTLYGSQGVGVHLIDNLQEFHQTSSKYHLKGYPVLIQPLLNTEIDLRLFVINQKIVACVKRQPARGDFRSNWHRGGQLKTWEPRQEIKNCALKAAEVLNLKVAAIDLIDQGDQFFILEANDSPGLEGISQAYSIDLAAHLLDFLWTTIEPAALNYSKL